jgi:hypothetical protein
LCFSTLGQASSDDVETMLIMFTTDDKTVCSCSGKTVWQEREEQRDRGML